MYTLKFFLEDFIPFEWAALFALGGSVRDIPSLRWITCTLMLKEYNDLTGSLYQIYHTNFLMQ